MLGASVVSQGDLMPRGTAPFRRLSGFGTFGRRRGCGIGGGSLRTAGPVGMAQGSQWKEASVGACVKTEVSRRASSCSLALHGAPWSLSR